MRSKKDFVHEEDVRTGPGWQRGWTNVVEGLELHKNLLSPAEQEIFIQAIKDWEAQGRRVSHSCPLPFPALSPCGLMRAKRGAALLACASRSFCIQVVRIDRCDSLGEGSLPVI